MLVGMRSRFGVLVGFAVVACEPDAPAPAQGESSSSSGDAVCEVPVSDAAQPVTVRLRNEASTARWIVEWSCVFPFDLVGPDGVELRERAYGWCSGCEGVVADGCEPWCEEFCDGVTVGIEPGGVFEATWQGRLHDTVTLECASCNATCGVATAAPRGKYRTGIRVYDACEATAPMTCECSSGGDICELWGAVAPTGDGIEFTQDFEFPSAEPVELVIAD
jgi:hypothetical protein